MSDDSREFKHNGHTFTVKTNRHHGTEMISFKITRDDGEKVIPQTLLLPYDPMAHGKDIAAVFDMVEVYLKSR